MDFGRWLLAAGREAWALLLLVMAGGVGLGAWWGIREGETHIKAGQASTILELRSSLQRLTEWFKVLEASRSWPERETASGAADLANLITLCRREIVALEHYLRDIEGAPRPGLTISEGIKRRRAGGRST